MRFSVLMAAAFMAGAILAGPTAVEAKASLVAIDAGTVLSANEEGCGGAKNPCKPKCIPKPNGKGCKKMGSER